MLWKATGDPLGEHATAHPQPRYTTEHYVHSTAATQRSRIRIAPEISHCRFVPHVHSKRTIDQTSQLPISTCKHEEKWHIITYRTGVVNSPYGFTLTRNLQIQRFREFISNPLLKLRRSSRRKVRRRLSRLTTVLLVHRVQRPTVAVLALSYTKIDQPFHPSTHSLTHFHCSIFTHLGGSLPKANFHKQATPWLAGIPL